MKKKILTFVLLLSIVALYGCQSKPTVVAEAPTEVVIPLPTETISTEGDINESELKEGQVYSPLTGLPVDAKLTENRPVAIMIDNYVEARPQSGLKDAEIVYEILAEGMITRYMAIFQTASPESVGPIRSSRMYYIQKALEYDPLYVHVGGSPEALKILKTLNIGNVDGLVAGKDIFWRLKHKKAPNNMYSSMVALRKQAANLKHNMTATFESWLFHHVPEAITGDSALKVKLVYKKPNDKDKVGYYTTYAYDETLGKYKRGFNGKAHLDEVDGTVLTAMNIIIQVAKHRVLDNKGRLEVDVVGEGTGLYMTMGNQIPITWKKPKTESITRFFDGTGTEITFNPGVTWVQVIDSLTSVTTE